MPKTQTNVNRNSHTDSIHVTCYPKAFSFFMCCLTLSTFGFSHGFLGTNAMTEMIIGVLGSRAIESPVRCGQRVKEAVRPR